MRNIWKVFITDFKRITSNVVALVIIMGLSIIPALYAWFNIMSNWNPYGKEATSGMKIAVFTEDEGFSYGQLSINIGDKVIDNLATNDTIAWQFPETMDDTLEGVYSGDYYAALVIPDNFTEQMLSFLGGNIEHPMILYYENSKKNAIATKITSKVKTTVQQSVNATVISTIVEIASKGGEVLTGTSDSGENPIVVFTDKVEGLENEIGTYASLLNGFAIITDSSENLLETARGLLPTVQGVMDSADDSMDGMKATIEAGQVTAETIEAMVDMSLETVDEGLAQLETQVKDLTIDVDEEKLMADLEQARTLGQATIDILNQFKNGQDAVFDQAVEVIKSRYGVLGEDIEKYESDKEKTQQKLDELKVTLLADLKNCRDAISGIQTIFDGQITVSLQFDLDEITASLEQAQQVLAGLDEGFPQIDDALADYMAVLQTGTDELYAARDYLYELRDGLSELKDAMKALQSDANYDEIVSILETDPALISEFVAAPIQIETKTYYEIENYGSAMAPFYTVLALWVGGLILVALLHVKVKDCPEISEAKNYQKFFGRYLTFFFVGQVQTLITVLGDLFFVQIQCLHPLKFYFAAFVMSLMFSFFMYALTVAWGNVGQAIAVVVMVIQVAGAGGTFPIEVLPKAYQAVYNFLPFTYAMNALRECVGGTYQNDYWKDLGVLGIYILISAVIGLFFGKPFVKLGKKLDESKEKSGIML